MWAVYANEMFNFALCFLHPKIPAHLPALGLLLQIVLPHFVNTFCMHIEPAKTESSGWFLLVNDQGAPVAGDMEESYTLLICIYCAHCNDTKPAECSFKCKHWMNLKCQFKSKPWVKFWRRKRAESHLTCEGIPANSPVFISSSTCSRTATGLQTDRKPWKQQKDRDGHDNVVIIRA